MDSTIRFKTMGRSASEDNYKYCRRMLVGPWCNQPEEYEGYNGFVGWPAITRLRSGKWLVTFTSGCWHVTGPWTEEIRKDQKCREKFESWHKSGCPDIPAPRGGRMHIISSDDQGLTWSSPSILANTEYDDRSPSILELDNGVLFCTFFNFWYPDHLRAAYMLSHDVGKSWTQPRTLPDHPVGTAFSSGPAIQLSSGELIWAVEEGSFVESFGPETIAVYRSVDSGESFQRISTIKTDHSMTEPTMVQMPDGRLVLLARRQGDIYWSNDGGQTWTQPESIGVDLFDPHLLLASNGVLACFHGSYKTGGLRIVLSPDGGKTWHGPEEGLGYSIDTSVYGYSHQMLLPDDSIYCVYQSTGGHLAAHARTMALWGLCLRINDEADGIEILPAPGSPKAQGHSTPGFGVDQPSGGDPELGNQL